MNMKKDLTELVFSEMRANRPVGRAWKARIDEDFKKRS